MFQLEKSGAVRWRHQGFVVLLTRVMSGATCLGAFLNSKWTLLGLATGSPAPHVVTLCWALALSSNSLRCYWCKTSAGHELWQAFLFMRYLMLALPGACLVAGDLTPIFTGWAVGVSCIVLLQGFMCCVHLSAVADYCWSDGGVGEAVCSVVVLAACVAYAEAIGEPCWSLETTIPLLLSFCFTVGVTLVVIQVLIFARVQLLQELEKSKLLRCQLQRQLEKSELLGAQLQEQLQMSSQLSERLHNSLQEVSGKLARTREAVSRIVTGVCECIFRLDNELCISEPSPALFNLLNAEGPHNQVDLTGRSILEFMSPDNSDRVRNAFVSSADTLEGAAAALPLELIDARGCSMPLVMYHTRVDDTEHVAVLRHRCEEVETRTSDGVTARRLVATTLRDGGSESLSSTTFADSEASGGVLAPRDEHVIVIDAGKPSLDVVKCSRLFKSAGLGHADCGLLDLMPAGVGRQLDSWVYNEVQRSSSKKTSRSRAVLRGLKLELPPNPGVHIAADSAWLQFDGLEGCDAEIPVALRLSGLRVRPRRRGVPTPRPSDEPHAVNSLETIQERVEDGGAEADSDNDGHESTDDGSSILAEDSFSMAGTKFFQIS